MMDGYSARHYQMPPAPTSEGSLSPAPTPLPAASPGKAPAPGASSAPARLTQLVRRWLPNLIGIALLAWFLRGFDIEGFRAALLRFPATAVLLIAGWALVSSAAQGVRFYLVAPTGLSLWRHIGLSFALLTGNILLPLRSGEI